MIKKILLPISVCWFLLFLLDKFPITLHPTGLVGWWPFNGNAIDESGNGIDGTVNGAYFDNR